MITIYKYAIGFGEFTLDLPIGAKILDVQTQAKIAYLWAEVDTEVDKEKRTFSIFCTGDRMDHYPCKLSYRGTFQLQDGDRIYHLYEQTD